MQTTLVKDSIVGDDWIKQACAANPVQYIIDPKTGQPNGNLLSGPVRLAFTDALYTPKPKMSNDPNSKVGFFCTLLFPPTADLKIIYDEYNRIAGAEFAAHWTQQGWAMLDPPVRNQAEKPQFSGYTPNCAFMNVSSGYKPAIVDMNMNPIVDQTKIYPGVWAVVALSCYASGKGTPRKGPRFGLQTIMKIADDTSLGGAAPDPRTMYGGFKPVTPPTGPVASQFGQGAQPAQQFGAPAVAKIYGTAEDDVSGFM